ncbi:MAG: YgjV family protein [Firmicutes bacterium]|nr:YgjV family protein [Bacillota bacterium]
MLEYLGYLASIIVLISLLMSSIKKLRWINLLGSITFAVYGFMIGAIPVGLLNIGTTFINLYYLYKIYHSKDYFTLLPITASTVYFEYYLKFHQKDIQKFFPQSDLSFDEEGITFYILRNTVPAGVFVGTKYSEDTLKVSLDYVVPMYRDFKMGKYVYTKQKELFLSKGYSKLVSFSDNPQHEKYLLKMGYVKQDSQNENNQSKYLFEL